MKFVSKTLKSRLKQKELEELEKTEYLEVSDDAYSILQTIKQAIERLRLSNYK